MKKRTLKEELERIHTITYGKQFLSENNLFNSIVQYNPSDSTQPVVDDPEKADYVTADVKKFFMDFDAINEPVVQQRSGSMEYQKQVELCQIALVLLGYELPRHGIDGLFGPETAAAVNKYKKDNNILSEASSLYDGGGNVRIAKHVNTDIDTSLQSIIDAIASEYGKPFTVVSGFRDPEHNRKVGGASKSQHLLHNAVDISIPNASKEDTLRFVSIASKNGIGGIGVYRAGSVHIDVRSGKMAWGPDHSSGSIPGWAKATLQDHMASKISGNYVPSVGDGDYSDDDASMEIITSEMIDGMVSKLETRGVTEEELQKLIDEVKSGGSADFTDLDLMTDEGYDKYAEICEKFISTRKPNLLEITGDMMARAARAAFQRHHKYVPPELALAQLAAEGGIGNDDPESRPIKTKNPFNVGNTDDGSNIYMGDVQNGINNYYNLIARNYLGKGKTAKDLVQNFVNHSGNHYATAGKYEKLVNQIAIQVNRMAKNMV
jgi:peptidoglycan hydrolase-like protein with peptidoglycan-binding domain